jgi:hypothetical protein
MKYFTRAQHDEFNRDGPVDYEALNKECNVQDELYRKQLEELMPRLSDSARTFFDSVSLHDGTLLVMRIGDDIHKQYSALSTLVVNRRRLSVELEALNRQESHLYTLQYVRIHRFVFDFPSAEPWYLRHSDRGDNPIDDWMADELTALNDQILRHEVLFSSGSTLVIEFESIVVHTRQIEGREGLPYLDEPS